MFEKNPAKNVVHQNLQRFRAQQKLQKILYLKKLQKMFRKRILF